MARLLFEEQSIRTRRGRLVSTGTVFVAYTDAAGTVPADISATSGGSAIPGSAVAVADIAGLGPAAFRFYGPDGVDTLYLRCPSDTSLGVQEIEADTDERLDALEAGGGGGGGAHPDLATHDTLGLATDAELATHEADTTAVHGIADTSALATSSSVTSAVSGHEAAANPHPAYALDTDLSAHDADTSVHGIADTSVLATDAEVTSAVSGHAAAADPHGDRAYADTVAQGLDPKASVLVKSTGNLTLSGEQTIDGVLTSASRVLVADQTVPAENGIYVSAAGAWTRATDADVSGEVTTGLYCFVEEGTAQASSGWVLITPGPITLGTTPLTFSQFSQAGQVFGGAGLLKTGNTLDVIAGTGIAVAGDTVGIAPGGVTNTQVNAAAAIAESKLALNFPTHAEDHAARHAAAGADPLSGYATTANLNTHEGAADPHQGYVLESAHTLAAHDTLGVVTDAILATHEADTTVVHGIANTARLVLDADLFAPPSIPGLHAWYAADRITGLADAAAVATWADISGHGRDATQATGANQPTYRTGIVNSLPAVLFDGANDSLTTATFAALATSTVVAVVKLNATSGSRDITDGPSGHRHMLGVRSGVFTVHQGSGTAAGPAADTAWHVLAGLFSGSTTSGDVADGTAAATSNVGTNTLTGLTIGAQGATPGEFLSGYVAELAVYDHVLSVADRQQLEWYLATKYGLTTASSFVPGRNVAGATRAARLSVTDRGLWVSTSGDDDNDGLSGGSAKATVQAALTAIGNAGGGTVNILGGTHIQTTELVAPVTESLPIRIIGQGHALTGAGTTLQWPVDLGADKFGIRPTSAVGAYDYLTVEQLRLLGPSNSVSFGSFPAVMDGVQMARRVQVRDCTISGFRAGIKVVADHNRIERVTAVSNGYGVYWQDMVSYGDLIIVDADLSGQRVASLAIGDDGSVLGTNIIHGHLGFCPYSIYIEPRDPSGTAMGTVTFDCVSFESAGNGHIISEDLTAKIEDCIFRSNGTWSLYNIFAISGQTAPAIIQAGSLLRNHFYNNCPNATSGDRDPVTAGMIANTFNNNTFEQGSFRSAVQAFIDAGIPPVQAKTAGQNSFRDGTSAGYITKASSGGAITAGQLVSWASTTNRGLLRPHASAFSSSEDAGVAGVAWYGGPANNESTLQDCVVMLTEGEEVITLTGSATPAAGTWLMADSADRNKIVASDGRLDLPLIGFASGDQSGTTSGTNCKVDLHQPTRPSAVRRKTVTGSRGGNAALADLLTELAALGLITDSSTA